MDAKTIRSRLALLLACSLFQFAVSAAPPAAKKAFVSFKAPAGIWYYLGGGGEGGLSTVKD